MSEREDIRAEIRALEAERERLLLEEQILDEIYWICPDGPQAKAIDNQIDEILETYDARGEMIGRLKNRLWVLDGAIGRREHIADVAYGRNP